MRGAGPAAVVAGWPLAGSGGHRLAGVVLVAAGLIAVAVPLWRRARRVRAVLAGRRPGRLAGTATGWDVARTSSAWVMRRRMPVLRPSLRTVSWWARWRVPVRSYATPLCTVGRQRVWISCEESTLRIGIPGTGKTAELMCRVADAPGGVLVTSTATDLYEQTAGLRARRGPVAVFNPGGIGAVPSTLRWSPLSGCGDPAVAVRRADDLMGPASGSAEAARWEIQARRVLAVLLHAAALGGYRMADVAGWIANPDRGHRQIIDALMESPQAVQMCRAADQAIGMNPRTRDGVMMPIAAVLAWVTLPAAAATGDPDPGAEQFTVTELTDRSGSLYLLGDDNGTVGPLTAALTAEIVYQARAAAAVRPGGRLDPALTLALDEVALVCPTPLDRWMAELRKRNIVIHAACQGLGQLRQRWGDNGASMILNSAAAVLVYGGCKDANDLALFARLAGDRDEATATRDPHGQILSTSVRRVPVIDAATLTGLPNHHALLVRRGMPTALARTPIGWRRRDIRRAGPPPTPSPTPAPAPPGGGRTTTPGPVPAGSRGQR